MKNLIESQLIRKRMIYIILSKNGIIKKRSWEVLVKQADEAARTRNYQINLGPPEHKTQ